MRQPGQKPEEVFRIRAQRISRAALGLVLIAVFFTLFRGMSNIFNAFLIPLTMALMMHGQNRITRRSFLLAAVLLVLLFFPTQMVFILLYALMAETLGSISRMQIPVGLQGAGMGILAGGGFWAAILITDAVFQTQIHAFMMILARGSLFHLMLIMLGEGMLIGFSLVLGQRFLAKRFKAVQEASQGG